MENFCRQQYGILDQNTLSDWREVGFHNKGKFVFHFLTNEKMLQLADRPKLCDVVVITTLDHMHVDPAIAFANLGYDILLEKPMAVTIEDCRRITEVVIRNQVNYKFLCSNNVVFDQ